MKPPRLSELLEDPVYRAYMKRIPTLAPTLRHGEPWAVWARVAGSYKWRGKDFSDYREAWRITIRTMRDERYEDVAIVSKRQLFAPPENFFWSFQLDWCSRCRRPSSFMERPNHHALRKAPVLTEDDAFRCYFCGMRRCAMPAYAA